MGIGTSIFLIALGAILRYGVQDGIEAIDLPVIGLILMIVGAIGLAISLLYMTMWRDRSAPPAAPPAAPPPPDRPVARDREYY